MNQALLHRLAHRLRATVALACGCAGSALVALNGSAVADEIPIELPQRERPVDFDTEIKPLLSKNCLACHNATEAESDLVLESVESILEGGSLGPAVEPEDPDASLLLQVSAHREEPVMPPEDNDVAAANFTPAELGLLSTWIAEGAKASMGGTSSGVAFERLPSGINPVYALAVSDSGQHVAIGRANQILIYHLPSQREVARLTDPQLIEQGLYENPGVAHLDLVQSLAFSPHGDALASGGYRTVKLWKQRPAEVLGELDLGAAVRSVAADAEGRRIAVGLENGKLMVVESGSRQVLREWATGEAAVTAVGFVGADHVVAGTASGTLARWQLSTGLAAGTPLTLPNPAVAVTSVLEGNSLAVAGSDHVIRLYAVARFEPPAEAETPAETPAEETPAEETPAEETPAEADENPVAAADAELSGHGAMVTALTAVDASGAQLISAGEDGKAILWDVAAAKPVREFGQGAAIRGAAVHAASGRLATAGANNSVKLWNLADGKPAGEIKGDLQAELDAAARQVAAGLATRHVALAKADLDEATQRKASEEENLKKAEEAFAAAETDRGEKQAAQEQAVAAKATADQELAQAQARMAAAEQVLAESTAQLTAADAAVKQSTAKRDAANGELNKTTDAFKTAAAPVKELQAALDANPADVAALQNLQAATVALQQATEAQLVTAQLAATSEAEFQQATAALQAATEAKQAAEKEKNEAQAAIKPAEDKAKAAGDAAQQAQDALTTAERTFASAERSRDRGQQAVAQAAELVPQREAAMKDAEAAQQAAQAAQAEATQRVAEGAREYLDATFVADGATLLTADATGRLAGWDAASAQALAALPLGDQPARRVLLTPEDHRVVVSGQRLTFVRPGGEWVLDRTLGSPDGESPFVDRITAMDFAPGGDRLAIGSGEPSRSGEIVIWDLNENREALRVPEPHSDTVWSLQFSPDGTQLASGAADRFMKTFNVQTGELLRTFEGHTHHVLGVAWSADGRTLASAGADKTVKIWSAATGDQQQTIAGFNKEATDVEFVGLENQVLVSSGDQSVTIKRADNGGNIRGFGGFPDFVYCVQVTPDGQRILAGGQDSVVRVWGADGKLIAEFKP